MNLVPVRTEVALVHMPYAAVERPSLALGLLQAILGPHLRVATANAHLAFAEEVGLPLYLAIGCFSPETLAGEWTFSHLLFDRQDPEYLGRLRSDGLEARGICRASMIEGLQRLREAAGPFLERLARHLLERGARVVGCTSTFQQHCPSLALLKRVKELDPSVRTLLGGANCDGPMGPATQRCFPFVDAVVSGEADEVILEVVRGSRPQQRQTVRELPPTIPDYHDYFAQLRASPLQDQVQPGIPIETSRGCWWGAKHHCTFCGLNGGAMAFRSKPPQDVLEEIETLQARHGIDRFMIVDNILDMSYLRTVMPGLETRNLSLFVETKANLKRPHLEQLARSGARYLLPGLESLDDRPLQLMDKGCTAMQNLQVLKDARELGIFVSWNLLCDFPGEEDAWYQEMADLMPRLFHLQPPYAAVEVRYDRFSPYHQRPHDFGIRMRPNRNYSSVYDLPAEDLEDLAYYFEDAPGSIRSPRARPGLEAVRKQARAWTEAFYAGPVVLTCDDDGDTLQLLDTRPSARHRRVTLSGEARATLLKCRTPQRLHAPELLRDGYLVERHGKLLALPLQGNLPRTPSVFDFPGGCIRPRAPLPTAGR